MPKVFITEQILQDTAEAIRYVEDSNTSIIPLDFPRRIRDLKYMISNAIFTEYELERNDVALCFDDSETGDMVFIPVSCYNPSTLDSERYVLKPFVRFHRGKNGVTVVMHTQRSTSQVWCEFNRYKLECDTTQAGGFHWEITINGTVKSGDVSWEANDTLYTIVTQLNGGAVYNYLVFSQENNENFIRIRTGGTTDSTFTLTNERGAVLTDLSFYVKVNGVLQTEEHRTWQCTNVNVLFPNSGFISPGSVIYGRNGYNTSYRSIVNAEIAKAYFSENGSETYIAETTIGKMSPTAFANLNNSGVAEQQALYDKYNGSWDAYIEAGVVNIDDTHTLGMEYRSYDNGNTQNAFLASVSIMDFDGNYIPLYPLASWAASLTDTKLGAFHLPTIHEIAILESDDVAQKLNKAMTTIGKNFTPLQHTCSVARYSAIAYWLYNANSGTLGGSGVYFAYASWAVGYLPLSKTYLCFTMPKGGTVTLTKYGTPTEVTLEYSIDNCINWTTWTETENVRSLTLAAGQTIHIRNTSETSTRFSTSASDYYTFSFSDITNAYGDTRSLLCSTPSNGVLTNYVFRRLFYGCTSLVSAPELPAMSLADNCYSAMFQSCSSLVSAPELPAMTLASYCYSYMFRGCSSLVSAPELPAMTLASYCYASMFNGCSSLNDVTMSATDISVTNCLQNWLNNVAATGDLYCPAELTIPTGVSGIPSGWTRHDYPDNTWLHFKMPEGGTVSLTKNGTPTEVTLEYSLDNGSTWTEWTETENVRALTLAAGQTMHVRNSSETSVGFSTSSSDYYNFAFTADTYVGGNTNSLLCKNSNNAIITSYCYIKLFSDCTSLTMSNTFTLPSTTLAIYCYSNIFRGCINLTMGSAFTLSATTLETGCYYGMFYNCISLTMNDSFVLPATTLVNACYYTIFFNCSNLDKVKTAMTDISAQSCITYWLNNVSPTGDFYCPAELTIPTGASGIPSGWTRHNIDGDKYLNFTMPDGGTITLTKNGTPTEVTLEYLIEGEPNWVTWSETNNVRSLTLNAGGKVYIRNTSDTSTRFSTGVNDYYNFAFTTDTYAGGNTNSLLCKNPQNATITSYCYSDLFRGCTSLTMSDTFALPSTTLAGYCYYYMFYGCTSLTMSDTFTLPATTLANACYSNMFRNCISLTMSDTFTLPATTLANDCYNNMFRDCTSLIMSDTFALPSTTLAGYCYYYMFYGCTSLTMNDTFTLPATTLANACYNNMFYGCTSLTMSDTFALPSTTLANACYQGMFVGCTSLTMNDTFTLPATTLANACYSNMFYDCTSLTMNDTFTLPATTLAEACYAHMFYGCTNINLMRTSMTDISASNCLSSWLYKVSATGDFYCPAELTIPTGVSGIPSGWTRHDYPDNTWLHFKMPEGGTVSLIKNGTPTEVTLEYSLDNGSTWTEWTETENVRALTLAAGQTMHVRNTSETNTGFSTSLDNYYKFTFGDLCLLGGNINSLLCKDSSLSLLTSFSFYNLFSGCTSLTMGESFSLPATTLATSCYRSMFRGCTNLTMSNSFSLPATTMESYCYVDMFRNCTSLTMSDAFTLPATTLATHCYDSMFCGCTSLTMSDAFTLPATTLATFCYYYMFYDCTSLTMNDTFTLPATTLAARCYSYMFYHCTSLILNNSFSLPATTLASYCYNYMFTHCVSLTQTPSLPATTLVQYCYSYMFQGCTALTQTPSLPATTLAEGCYAYMFRWCAAVNNVKTLMTDISATFCLSSWLDGVSSIGDFCCPSGLVIATGGSGIPSGWTRHNIDGDKYLNFTMPDGGTITLTKNGTPTEVTLEYLIEGEPNWVTWTETDNVRSLTLNAGQKVYIRNASETSTGFSTSGSDYYLFAFTDDCYADGQTDSLLCKNYENASITKYCYRNLFYQSSLVTAPKLNSSIVRDFSYSRMFHSTKLQKGAEFGGTYTSLYGESHFQSMYENCVYLTDSNVLKMGYPGMFGMRWMFYGCSSLNKIVLQNLYNISADGALSGWVSNVAATGDFYCPAELTIPTGASGIPTGWTRHDLPTT